MATDSKKIVLITGANTGIGYETVKALLQSTQPYHIILGSRSIEKGNSAKAELQKEFPNTPSSIEVLQVDISSDKSIDDAFEKVKANHGHIDALVNNAGHSVQPVPGKRTLREAWNEDYDVNVSGTQVMTHVFAPLLIRAPGARLLFVTSGLASLQRLHGSWYAGGPEPSEAGWPKASENPLSAYRSSKTALNMMMLNWHYLLKPDGVKVFSISPGMLATNLGGIGPERLKAMGASHPSIGGNIIKDVIEGKRDAEAGQVVAGQGVQPF